MISPLNFPAFAASFFRPNPSGDGTTMPASTASFMDYVDDACMRSAAGAQGHGLTDGTSNTIMQSVVDLKLQLTVDCASVFKGEVLGTEPFACQLADSQR